MVVSMTGSASADGRTRSRPSDRKRWFRYSPRYPCSPARKVELAMGPTATVRMLARRASGAPGAGRDVRQLPRHHEPLARRLPVQPAGHLRVRQRRGPHGLLGDPAGEQQAGGPPPPPPPPPPHPPSPSPCTPTTASSAWAMVASAAGQGVSAARSACPSRAHSSSARWGAKGARRQV